MDRKSESIVCLLIKKKMLGIFSSLKKRGKILRIKIGDLKRNVDWVFIIVACVGNTSV